MPGSTAETVHGRRGGGWLPKTTKPAAAPKPARTPDPTCTICDRPYSAHSGRLCLAYNCPEEHHTDQESETCWEGRGRMARARRHAGLILNHIDRTAIARTDEP